MKYTIHGKQIESQGELLYGGLYDNAYHFFRVWIHFWNGGQTQCAETLTKEEIGQLMGGN